MATKHCLQWNWGAGNSSGLVVITISNGEAAEAKAEPDLILVEGQKKKES